MTLRLHNSLTGTVEPFEPLRPGRVTMYVCGPTVYNYAHIGNARPAVVFDVLHRYLHTHYDEVVFARNFTDVDDKINAAAAERGVSIGEITTGFEAAYREDMHALNVRAPTLEPRATENIEAMQRMIERLLELGHAYEADGHVLFDVTSYSDYGSLANRQLDDMVAGARVEVAPYKRDPADFVLWKPSDPSLPGWDSPWGRGRPGWHIECSAMIAAHLGTTIDIHGGGQDLLFPHHENEQAQSLCAHGGEPFVRYWLHNGMLTVEQEKMSKSLGNFRTVRDLLNDHAGETLRMALLSAHYRQPLHWSDSLLAQCRATLDRWYRLLLDSATTGADSEEMPDDVCAAIEDDLNTPAAMAALSSRFTAARKSSAAGAINEFITAARSMGLLTQDPDAWFSSAVDVDVAQVERLIADRDTARAEGDYARADAIREQLTGLGIQIEDGADGTRWKRA